MSQIRQPILADRPQLSIRFTEAEGALTRALLVVGRRGWSIADLRAWREPGCLRVDAQLEATPRATPLPARVLQRQLARLHDVSEVVLRPPRVPTGERPPC
ncbi:hypothetical protein PPSIR1_35132 [Plesiocystis pacifica SIR-1]|uniref:Uncharacterized protein n=1 Tax=Plesiocystis pacifica SIR-1 TaxID=391625 RepID=A6G3T4_9BACT|nr:ACT domain-containing protein [Plesiocystis pacifica]EDM79471.1 hypothetical protein PPSIR1_35132 [Plesiocystis pacifica SIR-1]